MNQFSFGENDEKENQGLINSAINSETRIKIRGFLEGFIENVVIKYKGRKINTFESPSSYLMQKSPKKRELKPFHAAIIPPEILRINQFERGFSTGLGSSFEECAKLIALQHHEQAERGYTLQSKVSRAAMDEIDHQIEIFET